MNVVDMNSLATATMSSDGQLILTGEDGQAYPVTVSGMITVPSGLGGQIPAGYQAIVTSSAGGQQQILSSNIEQVRYGFRPNLQSYTFEPLFRNDIDSGSRYNSHLFWLFYYPSLLLYLFIFGLCFLVFVPMYSTASRVVDTTSCTAADSRTTTTIT